MDDRTLLRIVLLVATLSLLVNVYTLYQMQQQAATGPAPANKPQTPCEKLCLEQTMADGSSYPRCVRYNCGEASWPDWPE